MGFSMIDCSELRVLSFIGKNSFILYLLQGKTICRFPYILFNTGIRRVVSFGVVLLMSIVLAEMTNKVIEVMEMKGNT